MSLQEIITAGGDLQGTLTFALTFGVIILAAFSTLVQVSPIKINPWSWLAKKIGKAMNGEVIEKVEQVSADLNSLRIRTEERDTDLCRTRILRFGDELVHCPETYHTKEHFDQIMDDIDHYEKYCENHPLYRNNKAVITIEKIKRTYQTCMDKHTFL